MDHAPAKLDKETAARDAAEQACLRAVAQGDAQAFETLYRMLHPRLFRFVLRVLGRLDLVDDVLSETMLAVWRGASAYRADARAQTWVFGIAYHKALQALRRTGLNPLEEHAASDAAVASPEQRTDDAWVHDAVRRALASLPADQRAAIELTFFNGYSCDEVAAIVGCPAGTVKSRMFLARARLRPLLARLHQESR
jgi:RNA polymerase sigma factor (sigma-70 family)